MFSSKILGIALLASVVLLAVVATTPGINSIVTGVPQVQASQAGDDKECLSASSALFFDTQSALTSSA